MNFRTTLVLLCILIAVGIIVVVTQKKDLSTSATDTTTTGTNGPKAFSLTTGDITKVSFTGETDQPIVIEKQGMKWSLTSPVKGPADDTAVSTLLNAIADADIRGSVDAGPSTGLDSPAHKVEVTTRDNQTISFEVGSRSATGEVAYIKRQNQKQADVVPVAVADALDKPLKEWRRAKLLDVGATEIKQLRVASTQPTMELQKQGENWQMMSPTTEPVDAIAVSDLTSAAANLHADEFVSDTNDDAARYGLDQPVMTVVFDTTGIVMPPATAPATASAPTTIKFGRFGDVLKKDVYAELSSQPGIFKVSATTLNAFHKLPLELRDKKVATIDPASVTKIEIVKDQAATTQPTTRPASSKTTVLALRPPTSQPTTAASSMPAASMPATQPTSEPASKWIITSKNDDAADDAKIQTLLDGLHPLRVERYEESADAAQPVDSYTITLHAGPNVEIFRLSDTGGTQPLRGQYNGLNFVASREMIDSFDTDFAKSAARPAMPGSPMMPGMMPPGMQ